MRFRFPTSSTRCRPSQATQAGAPLNRIRPGSSATAARRPIVAIVPLSRYRKASVPRPSSSLVICLATCLPPCMATGASWGSSSPSRPCAAAMSPIAQAWSCPGMRRSGVTTTRPPRSCSTPRTPASGLGQRARRLDAGWAAADDREREPTSVDLRGIGVGGLEALDDVVPEGDGVLQRVEREPVLGRARCAEVGHGRAAGHHEVVEPEGCLPVEQHGTPLPVDACHAGLPEGDVALPGPARHAGCEPTPSHRSQHR